MRACLRSRSAATSRMYRPSHASYAALASWTFTAALVDVLDPVVDEEDGVARLQPREHPSVRHEAELVAVRRVRQVGDLAREAVALRRVHRVLVAVVEAGG